MLPGELFQRHWAAAKRRVTGYYAERTIRNSNFSLPGEGSWANSVLETSSTGYPYPIINSSPLFVFPNLDDKTLMTRTTVMTGAGFLLFAHLATLFIFQGGPAVSIPFLLTCSISAVGACYWRSTRSSGPVRRKWDFLASALSLWSIGEAFHLFRILDPTLGHNRVLGPEFYFVIYGIPVLLALSTSNEDRDTPLFVVIDSLQALFAVALVYLELSLSELGTNPSIGPTNLSLLYGVGAWTLAGASALRVIARPSGEERALYRILVTYLSLFALLATPWRGTCVLNALPLGIYRDLPADLAFLVLTTGCLLYGLAPKTEAPPLETNAFALVLNNGSPILFTLAVLALGAMVARRHLALGMSAIGLSLITYCFRATLLQSAYMRAQHALTRSQYALREANAQLRQLSLHDGLTGLPNRRQFDLTLELEWSRALRNRRPLSLILLDVDCFKALNDLYGHPVGDDCLQRIAGALQRSLRRAGEIAARYGGEEFAAILPDVDPASAASVAETMREAVLHLQMLHDASLVERFVTISLGVATAHPSDRESPASLVAAADEALYRAKASGRNRVETQDTAVVLLSAHEYV
jgi:diguanylate cyclase (GGDEF)-like protein